MQISPHSFSDTCLSLITSNHSTINMRIYLTVQVFVIKESPWLTLVDKLALTSSVYYSLKHKVKTLQLNESVEMKGRNEIIIASLVEADWSSIPQMFMTALYRLEIFMIASISELERSGSLSFSVFCFCFCFCPCQPREMVFKVGRSFKMIRIGVPLGYIKWPDPVYTRLRLRLPMITTPCGNTAGESFTLVPDA